MNENEVIWWHVLVIALELHRSQQHFFSSRNWLMFIHRKSRFTYYSVCATTQTKEPASIDLDNQLIPTRKREKEAKKTKRLCTFIRFAIMIFFSRHICSQNLMTNIKSLCNFEKRFLLWEIYSKNYSIGSINGVCAILHCNFTFDLCSLIYDVSSNSVYSTLFSV